MRQVEYNGVVEESDVGLGTTTILFPVCHLVLSLYVNCQKSSNYYYLSYFSHSLTTGAFHSCHVVCSTF